MPILADQFQSGGGSEKRNKLIYKSKINQKKQIQTWKKTIQILKLKNKNRNLKNYTKSFLLRALFEFHSPQKYRNVICNEVEIAEKKEIVFWRI